MTDSELVAVIMQFKKERQGRLRSLKVEGNYRNYADELDERLTADSMRLIGLIVDVDTFLERIK